MPTIPFAVAFGAALLFVTTPPRQAGKKVAPAENLARNGGFEEGAAAGVPNGWFHPKPSVDAGYQVRVSKDKPQAGAACAVLSRARNAAAADGFGNLMQTVDVARLRGKRVRLRAAVRAQVAGDRNSAKLWLRIDRKGDQRGFFDNMGDRPITSPKWQHYEIVGDVADDAQGLVFGLLLSGSGSAALDDVSLTVVDASVPATGAVFNAPGPVPGLTEIEMAVTVRGFGTTDAVTYLYPLPLAYRDQVPLTFHLTVTPAAAGKSVTIAEGAGDNRVLKLALQGLQDREVAIVYRAAVLVAPTSFADVPRTVRFPASWPAAARPWLQSTWCCEHENERIEKIATELRGKSGDVREVITKVLMRARSTIDAAEGRVTELTAVQALDKQGSCTSNANLVAALLRGCGVPARILSGYPLWSGPLQTHYIVEAYVPDWGWYPVESTLCREPWPNHQQINVSIVPVEHESRKLAGARRCGGGGVPYLSLSELEDPDAGVTSVGALPKPYCDHEARMVRAFTASGPEWAAAIRWGQQRWTTWLDSKPVLGDGSVRFGPETKAISAETLADLRKALK